MILYKGCMTPMGQMSGWPIRNYIAKKMWYNPEINRFVDEDGEIQNNLHEFFPAWMLDKWKCKKTYDILIDRKGNLWELYWGSISRNQKTYCGCDHKCLPCPSKCEIYELVQNN